MSFGTFSVKISDYFDTELSAYYKTLFNKDVFNPTDDNLNIVRQAMALLNATNCVDPSSEELSYFANTWLIKADDAESKNDLMTYLVRLHNKIESRISRLKQAQEEQENQLARDWQVINEQKPLFLDIVRRGLAEPNTQIRKETIKEANKYFKLALRRLHTEEILYDAICNDDVADFYYLRCQGEFYRKADFIIQCIRHNDYVRAEQLIARIIVTASYKDFYDMTDTTGRWKGYSWEWEAKNVISGVLRDFNRKISCSYTNPPSNEEIQEVRKLALMIFPYLKEAAIQEVSSDYDSLGLYETDPKLLD